MSDEPQRLLDDPSTSEELRQALRQASGGAPPIDVALGLQRLERAIEGGGAASGGAGGSSGLGGVVGAGIVALAVVGGVMLWNPDERTEVTPAPVEEHHAEEPVAEEPVIAPPEQHVAPTTADDVTAPAERSETRVAPPTREADDDALAREMAELAAARSALAADPQRALSLLERGRRRAGARSLFAEEREALTVLALSGLDRDDDARRRGTAFLGAFPTSAFAERVRRAIAAD